MTEGRWRDQGVPAERSAPGPGASYYTDNRNLKTGGKLSFHRFLAKLCHHLLHAAQASLPLVYNPHSPPVKEGK